MYIHIHAICVGFLVLRRAGVTLLRLAASLANFNTTNNNHHNNDNDNDNNDNSNDNLRWPSQRLTDCFTANGISAPHVRLVALMKMNYVLYIAYMLPIK